MTLISSPWVSLGFIWAILIILVTLFLLKGFLILFLLVCLFNERWLNAVERVFTTNKGLNMAWKLLAMLLWAKWGKHNLFHSYRRHKKWDDYLRMAYSRSNKWNFLPFLSSTKWVALTGKEDTFLFKNYFSPYLLILVTFSLPPTNIKNINTWYCVLYKYN